MNLGNTEAETADQRIEVKIGVLLDATTFHIYEGEVYDIRRELERHLAPTHRPAIIEEMDGPDDLSEAADVDVLIVDYGGLHHAYGDIVHRYGTAVMKWAEEHPGRLVVLWTPFTSTLYRATFEVEFGTGRQMHRYDDDNGEYETCWRCDKAKAQHVPDEAQVGNILYRYGVGEWAFDNDEYKDFWQRLRAWIGVPDVATEGVAQGADVATAREAL